MLTQIKTSCRAPFGIWQRVFADSIMGVPFLRSVFSVFDYVSHELYSVQPRLGLASTVNAEKAKARYPDLYKSRMGFKTKPTAKADPKMAYRKPNTYSQQYSYKS